MSAVDLAVARLKTEEGFRSLPYSDETGHLSLGYGFSVGAGISKYAASYLLSAQVTELSKTLAGYDWFSGLDEVRASVFIDLAYNLGVSGLLHFPKTLTCASEKDWKGTHDNLLDSKAAKQDPKRYVALAQVLLTGVA